MQDLWGSGSHFFWYQSQFCAMVSSGRASLCVKGSLTSSHEDSNHKALCITLKKSRATEIS